MMKNCLLPVLLLSLVVQVDAPSADTTNPRAQQRYEQFKSEFKAAETRDAVVSAIKHGVAAHELAPTVFEYPYGVAKVYHYLDEYDFCVGWFDRAIALGPDDRLDSAVTSRRACEAQLALARVRSRDSTTLEISLATKMGSVNRELDPERVNYLPRLLPSIPDDASAQEKAIALQAKFSDMEVATFDDYVVVSQRSARTSARQHGERIAPFFNAIRKAHFSDDPIRPIVIVLGRKTYKMANMLKRVYPELNFPALPFFGFYSHQDRLIMAAVGAGYGTLLHELVHAFIAAQFPSAPLWYEESLATIYERTEWRGNTLRPLPNWRMDFINENTGIDTAFAGVGSGTKIGRAELAWLRMLLLFAFEHGSIQAVDAKVRQAPQAYLPQHVLAEIQYDWHEFVSRQFLEYRLEIGRAASNGLSGPEQIRFVQHALNAVIRAGLDEDGVSGTKTDDAIEEFQRQFGLDPDGVVGRNTMKRLRGELAKRALDSE